MGGDALAARCRRPRAAWRGTPRAGRRRRATRSRGRPRRRRRSGASRRRRGRGRPARRAPAGARRRGDEEVGAREGGGAQDRADLGAEPAAGDEDEALDQLGELVGELHRDAAAERVADERRALVAEDEQQVAQAAGERAERVVARAAADAPWPGQVRGDDGVRGAPAARSPPASSRRFRRCRGSSSRTGPSPASR